MSDFKWTPGDPYFEGIIRKPTDLPVKGVFVFGSNELGQHGAGAALTAAREFLIPQGMGFGLHMQMYYGDGISQAAGTFALPTKDWRILTLDLSLIESYVHRFLACTYIYDKWTFFVTQIGCGLAGHHPKDIAPFFEKAEENVILDKVFYDMLEN